MITEWTGERGFGRGIVLDNGTLVARILGRADLAGMMPTEFRLKGGDNLIHVPRQHAMYLMYPGSDIRESLKPASSEVVSDGDESSTLRQVWRHEDYVLTSLVSIVRGEATLYYDFEVEALRDFDRLTVVAAVSSKLNFNRFAVGNPTREFPFGTSDFFSDWAAAWSDARGEGLMLTVNGPGVFELQTEKVAWANQQYAEATRYYEGEWGNFWQIKCAFLLDALPGGGKRRFGWRLSHVEAYSPAAWAEKCKSARERTFFECAGKEGPLPEIAPQARRVSELRDTAWAGKRAEEHGVLKIAHFTSMPVGEWTMEENHPWKLPFITDKHFREGIDRAASLGFNTVCLWDGTYVVVDDDVKKRAIRYAHSRGLKAWYMVSLPYGTNTYPYCFADTVNSMPLVRLAIDKYCSAGLGEEAIDGFGWDWEEVPSPFLRGYGYNDGTIRADKELLALWSSRFEKPMLDSSLDETRKGYATLWGEWFGEVYRYLKARNEDCAFFVLGGWYEKHLARAITSNCPGIHIPSFAGGEGAIRLQGHDIRAWHNAGAHVSLLHREPYFENYGIRPTEIDGIIREGMAAGADGLFYFDFALHSEEVGLAYAEAMNKYFPGDLSRPPATYSVNPELPEYENGGLCFENVGDPASLAGPENRKYSTPIREMDEVDDGT